MKTVFCLLIWSTNCEYFLVKTKQDQNKKTRNTNTYGAEIEETKNLEFGVDYNEGGSDICSNPLMNECNVANCDVSCAGGGVDRSFSSSSKTVNGVTVHGATFNPKGSNGATCEVKCEGLVFKTTCQKSKGNKYAWTIPNDLKKKCGKSVDAIKHKASKTSSQFADKPQDTVSESSPSLASSTSLERINPASSGTCSNPVMNNCNVAKCKVSCSGGTSSGGMSSSSKTSNGVTVHSVTFNPKGSHGTTCTVKCEGLEFKTYCQKLKADTYAWEIPKDLAQKCKTSSRRRY